MEKERRVVFAVVLTVVVTLLVVQLRSKPSWASQLTGRGAAKTLVSSDTP